MLYIRTEKGALSLPADASMRVNIVNPIADGENGSWSYPISIKNTLSNKLIIGNVTDINEAYANKLKVKATAESNGFNLSGLLSYSGTDGSLLNLNFSANEGAFWAETKKINLPDLDWGGWRPTPSDENTPIAWAEYLKNCANNDLHYPDADLCVFPVLTQISEDDTNINYHSLNPIEYNQLTGEWYLYQGEQFRGITPFLFLQTAIAGVFKHFGLRVVRNDISLEPSLNRLVLLNNCMGAIATGLINYKYLVPDVTVEKFIKGVETVCGCTFHINYSRREVSIVRHASWLKSKSFTDITRYTSSMPAISGTDTTQLKLTFERNFELTDTPIASYDDLRAMYSREYPVPSTANIPTSGTYDNTLYYVQNEFAYYAPKTSDEMLNSNEIVGIERLSSNLFNYAPKADNYHTLESPVNVIATTKTTEPDTSHIPMPYFSTGLKQTPNTSFYLKNKADKCPFAMTVFRGIELSDGKYYPSGAPQSQNGWSFTPRGIYELSYKEYEQWKLKSSLPVKAGLNIPPAILDSLNLFDPVMIHGQVFLIAKLDVEMSEKNVKINSGELLTIKPYL